MSIMSMAVIQPSWHRQHKATAGKNHGHQMASGCDHLVNGKRSVYKNPASGVLWHALHPWMKERCMVHRQSCMELAGTATAAANHLRLCRALLLKDFLPLPPRLILFSSCLEGPVLGSRNLPLLGPPAYTFETPPFRGPEGAPDPSGPVRPVPSPSNRPSVSWLSLPFLFLSFFLGCTPLALAAAAAAALEA